MFPYPISNFSLAYRDIKRLFFLFSDLKLKPLSQGQPCVEQTATVTFPPTAGLDQAVTDLRPWATLSLQFSSPSFQYVSPLAHPGTITKRPVSCLSANCEFKTHSVYPRVLKTIALCLFHGNLVTLFCLSDRDVRFASKVGQIESKCDKFYQKKYQIVPFGGNLTHFGAKFDIPDSNVSLYKTQSLYYPS